LGYFCATFVGVEVDDIGQQRMKAVFNFEAIQEGDLSFKQGDKLIVTIE